MTWDVHTAGDHYEVRGHDDQLIARAYESEVADWIAALPEMAKAVDSAMAVLGYYEREHGQSFTVNGESALELLEAATKKMRNEE